MLRICTPISRLIELGAAPTTKGAESDAATLRQWADSQGYTLSLPFSDRTYHVYTSKGALVLRADRHEDDGHVPGWTKPNKKEWERVESVNLDSSTDIEELDGITRCLRRDNTAAGWAVKSKSGDWHHCSASEVKMRLQKLGHKKSEAEVIMGEAIHSPWTLVNEPFQPIETKTDTVKKWNLDGAQLRHKPIKGDCPTWHKILSHNGSEHPKGHDWLLDLLASIIQRPDQPTPYLFLYGEQNNGKSILHEAIDEHIVDRGVVLADRALKNRNDFNGELANAILAVVEETDLRQPGVYARLKKYVTSLTNSIRKMRTDSFMVRNNAHWLQCSNDPRYCPLEFDDTRVQVFHVPPLADEIPKHELMQQLAAEAPAFTYELVNRKLPEPEGRLFPTIIETASLRKLKQDALHPAVCAIRDLAKRLATPWTGTARQLQTGHGIEDVLQQPFSEKDVADLREELLQTIPRDARAFKSLIASENNVLNKLGIRVEEYGRSAAGMKFTIAA